MNDWDLSNIRADIMLATDVEHLQAIDNYYENKINNLQSKIGKANDKINQYELIVGYYDSNYDEYDDTYSHEIKDELLDILKEVE